MSYFEAQHVITMDLFLKAQLNRHNPELTWVSVTEAQPKPISRYTLDSLKNSWAQS